MININKKCGFNTLEVIITATIVAVLATVGYTSFSDSIRAQTAQGGVSQVAYSIKTAKALARSRGVTTSVRFPLGGNTYSILVDNQDITNTTNTGATSGFFSDNITIIQNTCNEIFFNQEGSFVDELGSVVYQDCSIVIGYSNGPQETITVKGKTGNLEND